MKLLKRVVFPILGIFLCSCLFIIGSSADSVYTFDDRDPVLVYSGRTAGVADDAYNGTYSRLSRGASVNFQFTGSYLALYALKYTNSGRARVYIDGAPVGYTSSGVTVDYTPVLSFSKTDLETGSHTCTIVAWDQTVYNPTGQSVTAYYYLDYIETASDLDPEPFYKGLVISILTVIAGLLLVFVVMRFAFWRLRND